MTTYHAHGKILLTGEYLVLHGAVALALPTKLGQSLKVEPMAASRHCERVIASGAKQSEAIQPDPIQPDPIKWSAYHPTGLWLSALFTPHSSLLTSTDPAKASKLSQILQAVHTLNPHALQPGLHFETHLEFNPSWGLGSSSTLISNLAQWADINPYELLRMTLGGSGYDIACATASSPIYYQLQQDRPTVTPASFNPPFIDHLFFVYQGKKQHSSEEVKAFNQHWTETDFITEMQTVSELSLALPTITYFEDFCTLLQVHEDILARCLGREPIQRQFPDFNGTLKSLGAWGGDFLLAATEIPYEEVAKYFENKGLTTIFKYQDLIL